MKRNKELCRKCKWRGHDRYDGTVFCYYAGRNDEACMNRDGTDKRGEDASRCLLFEEGKPERVEPTIKRKK